MGHSGRFSVHAGVRVAAQDSAGRERLLRYCARPMFAGERLVWAGGGAQVRYRLPCAALQGHRPEQQQQQRSIELRLSASEFLDRVAALIPPPRKHRHRYFGVLAPNSPWRVQVVAQNSKLHRNLNLCSQSVRLLRLDVAAEFTGFAAFTLRSCAAEGPALRAVWCDAFTRYAEVSTEFLNFWRVDNFS